MSKSKRKKSVRGDSLSPGKKAKLAVKQNEKPLREKFPNIASVSDAVHDLGKKRSHVIVIYLKDEHVKDIPAKLKIKLPKNKTATIATEIVRNVGQGYIHISQSSDNIADVNSSNYLGSICCLVTSTTNPSFLGIVTSGHVYTRGRFINFGGMLNKSQQTDVLVNGANCGKWYLQVMNNQQDLAIAKLKTTANNDPVYRSFANGYHTVTDKDVRTETPNITIVSKNYSKDGYILDYNVAFEINYHGVMNYISNIILVGSENKREDSSALTVGSDSGSCIYHKLSGKLVGMLLGGNDKFSFVLPIKQTLDYYNFKPV